MGKINKVYDINIEEVFDEIRNLYKTTNKDEVKSLIINEKLKRFKLLIDFKFPNEKIIYLLKKINNKDYSDVLNYTNWNTDIATIFEYLIAIAWYRISGSEGNIFEYLNLSLDSGMYPKSHASGGKADIIYKYNNENGCVKHNLLIEVTLTDSVQQRRAEMEPVSRHLIGNINKTKNRNDYVIFIAPSLHWSVSSDFRSRKNYYYKNKYGETSMGLKIIPIELKYLITLLQKNVPYSNIYYELDEAYKSIMYNDIDWYDKEIVKRIESL